MVIQNTVISFEQLVQDFDSLFRHRVFRLETLDWYDAPNEHEPYARFLAGEAWLIDGKPELENRHILLIAKAVGYENRRDGATGS